MGCSSVSDGEEPPLVKYEEVQGIVEDSQQSSVCTQNFTIDSQVLKSFTLDHDMKHKSIQFLLKEMDEKQPTPQVFDQMPK
ncbi:hypothetical protein L195_g011384, partial [Trifolium pratense]